MTALTGNTETPEEMFERHQREWINLISTSPHSVGGDERLKAIAIMCAFSTKQGCDLSDFKTAKRGKRHIAHIRQDCMRLVHEKTSLSLPAIGRLFGGRDHTTVMHGIDASIARASA